MGRGGRPMVKAGTSLTALFPGQGSQYVGMGKSLYETNAAARALFDRADAALGFSLTRICFEGPESELQLTRNTQPAILVHSLAAWELFREAGFRLNAAAGHSLGEYSALAAAGALSFEDAVRLVRRRGELMYEAGRARPGAMAAILGMDLPGVEELCREAYSVGIVVPANINSPGQVVISGEASGVEKAVELAPARGAKKAVRLPVSGAFHSPLMESAAGGLRAALEAVTLNDSEVPVVANVSARPVQKAAEIRIALEKQLLGAVRWEQSMRWLKTNAGPVFVEVGPGRVLKGLARAIDRDLKMQSVEDPESFQEFLDIPESGT